MNWQKNPEHIIITIIIITEIYTVSCFIIAFQGQLQCSDFSLIVVSCKSLNKIKFTLIITTKTYYNATGEKCSNFYFYYTLIA